MVTVEFDFDCIMANHRNIIDRRDSPLFPVVFRIYIAYSMMANTGMRDIAESIPVFHGGENIPIAV